MALLNITTPAEAARLVAAAPVAARRDVLRAVNPALVAELERIEAAPASAASRLRKLASPSAVELIGHVSNPSVLRAAAADPRDTVASAVITRANGLGVTLDPVERPTRTTTSTAERTARNLDRPLPDVLEWLVKAREVDHTTFEAWLSDVTPEKAAAWPAIVDVSRRYGQLHEHAITLTFAHDLGPAPLAKANDWTVTRALSEWSGAVNGTVLAALCAHVAEGFSPTMYKHRPVTVPLPPDTPIELRTALDLVTPDELDAALSKIGESSGSMRWRYSHELVTLASLAANPACVDVALRHLEAEDSYYVDTAATELLNVEGITFDQRVRLFRFIGEEAASLLVEQKLSNEDLDALVASLAQAADPAEAVSSLVTHLGYQRSELDFTWFFERLLRDVPASATALVESHPHLVMAHAASRLAAHPDAWGVVTSELRSYRGLFDELIDAAIAASV